MEGLTEVAGHFRTEGRIVDFREFGSGNINDTFLITLTAEGEKHFVLQRINTHVFSRPDLIMRNMRIATEHMRSRIELISLREDSRWEIPTVMQTEDGSDHWIDAKGSFWRAVSFIEGAESFDTIQSGDHASEVGYALGMFHTLLSDLPPVMLADTLEGFHITPRYLRHYEEVLAKCDRAGSPEVNYCIRFVEKRKGLADILEDAKAGGRLHLRSIHGDPKVNNILMDTETRRAVSIVDLDTVKPGLVHYDIGDCLRSGCNRLGEETGQWQAVSFDLDICRNILNGYLMMARAFLTGDDFGYLYDAMRLIAFELGLRFFTDYLEGDVYFKVSRAEQNLARALVQFKLAENIEYHENVIRRIIRDIR